MFAIRCYRLAAGAVVDGQQFSHDKWTLVDKPTDTQIEQSLPSEKWKQPLLQVIEVEDVGDPALDPFPVEGQEAADAENGDQDEEGQDKDGQDLTKLSLKELAAVAEPLGIAVKPNAKKADVITAIETARAALSDEETDDKEETDEPKKTDENDLKTPD